MRKLATVAVAIAILAGPGGAASATSPKSGSEVKTLDLPRPNWLTPKLEAEIVAAGPKGVEVPLGPQQALEPNCLGYVPPVSTHPIGVSTRVVSAGTCMVAPHGCTMNFIFADARSAPSSYYIGTAGHCVEGGRTVIAQVASRIDPTDTVIVTLAAIGTVVKAVNQGIGRDFALVKIQSGFGVNFAVAGVLGPTGVFCGDPLGQPVMHYGHGYIFFVEQGHPKFGEVIPDTHPVVKFKSTAHGFNWVGYGVPGDSGSGVMNAAGLGVGDLTHGIGVFGVPVPGLNFGTTMGGIFDIIGPNYWLVTADGRHANCSSPLGV